MKPETWNLKLTAAVEATMATLERALGQQRVVERLWARDASLWHPSAETQAGIARRLDWLELPGNADVEQIRSVAAAGGPALLIAPGDAGGAMRLWHDRGTEQATLLDGWAPEAVQVALRRSWRHVIVAADRPSPALDALLGATAGLLERARVVAVGPPSLVRSLAGRAAALSAPEGGARFGALGSYGLLAAALAGRDMEALTAHAQTALDACRSAPGANPGLRLGAALAALAQHGYDLLFVSAAPTECRVAEWTAGLLAGALAKHERGFVPIVLSEGQSPPLVPNAAQLVLLAPDVTSGDNDAPRIEFRLAGDADAGAYAAVWQIAVAIAAVVLGVNPFDEPDSIALERRLGQRAAGARAFDEHPVPLAQVPRLVDAAQARWLALVPYFAGNSLVCDVQALRLELEQRTGKPVLLVEPLRHGWATQLLHAGRPGGFALALAPPAGEDTELSRLVRARFELDVMAWRRMDRAFAVLDLFRSRSTNKRE